MIFWSFWSFVPPLPFSPSCVPLPIQCFCLCLCVCPSGFFFSVFSDTVEHYCMLQIMLGKRRGPCIKKCKTEGFALDFTDLHHVFHLSFWQFFETIFHISFRYFFLETFFENKVCTIVILWWAPASPLSASDSPTALLPDVKQRQAYNTKLERTRRRKQWTNL